MVQYGSASTKVIVCADEHKFDNNDDSETKAGLKLGMTTLTPRSVPGHRSKAKVA